MTPLVTYQFHQFPDSGGRLHVVKDTEVVQVRWAPTAAQGQVILANGQTITVSQPELQNSVIAQVTFVQVLIQSAWATDGLNHLLNEDRIDNVEWGAGGPSGVIHLSNGDQITVAMNPLIQIITALTNTINP
jgi:uncharacterized protein YlzI (FlbEa/FlbD family)